MGRIRNATSCVLPQGQSFAKSEQVSSLFCCCFRLLQQLAVVPAWFSWVTTQSENSFDWSSRHSRGKFQDFYSGQTSCIVRLPWDEKFPCKKTKLNKKNPSMSHCYMEMKMKGLPVTLVQCGLWKVSLTLTVHHRDTFSGRSRPRDGHPVFRDLYWAGRWQLLLSDLWHFHTVATMSQAPRGRGLWNWSEIR